MWLPCPECLIDSPFEQPPCQDGHGDDCPEWCCVTCGFAVFAGEAQVGWLPETADSAPAAASAPPAAKRRTSTRPHAA